MAARARPLRQLLLALVFFTQVPAVLAMVALVYVQYLRQHEAVEDDMVDRARNVAIAVRERLENAQTQLGTLAQQVPVDPAEMRRFHDLASQVQRDAALDSIALVRPDGSQTINTRVPFGVALPRARSGTHATFQSARKSVLDLAASSITGSPVAGVAVPVVRDSRIDYVLSASISATRFRDLLERQSIPDRWFAAIVDTQGNIVARVPHHEQFVGRRVSEELYRRITAAVSTSSNYTVAEGRTLEGIEVVTAMRRSPVNGWTVVVSVPRNVLNAPVWRSAVGLTALFLVVLTVCVGAALFMSAEINSCMRKLRDAAAMLPRGGHVEVTDACFSEAQQLGATLEQAGSEIRAANAEVHRVTEGFHRALVREVETQRGQIARELHDSVGSSLAGVSMLIGNMRQSTGDPRMSLLLEKAHEQVQRSVQEVREISHGMTPAGSEAGGLVAAIEHFAEDVTRYQGIDCVFRARGDFAHVPPETAAHVYRIVQEAVTNAIRHGEANFVHIRLAEAQGRYRLTIWDGGKGFDFMALPNLHPGMGLRSMQARARAIDAEFAISPAHTGGARVVVQWGEARVMEAAPA